MSGVLGEDGGPFQLHDFGKTILRLARWTSDSLTGVMRLWCSYYTSITCVSRRARTETHTHTCAITGLSSSSHMHTHGESEEEEKRRNGQGWARFWVEWNVASCVYRQSKCIWLETFEVTHWLKKTNPKNPKNKKIFLRVCARNSNHKACNLFPIAERIWPFLCFISVFKWGSLICSCLNWAAVFQCDRTTSVFDRNTVLSLTN